MSGLVHNISNLGRKMDFGIISGPLGKIDPAAKLISKADIGTQNTVFGKPQYGNFYGESPPTPPSAPTQDTAANSAMQQQDLLRKRRGVFGNIYAGNAAAPAVSTKSALGT